MFTKMMIVIVYSEILDEICVMKVMSCFLCAWNYVIKLPDLFKLRKLGDMFVPISIFTIPSYCVLHGFPKFGLYVSRILSPSARHLQYFRFSYIIIICVWKKWKIQVRYQYLEIKSNIFEKRSPLKNIRHKMGN